MKTTSAVRKRQRRVHRTHTKARLSGRPRLVVYRSLRAVYGQIVDDATGKVLCGASNLKEKGNTVESAHAAGKALAELAKKHKIEAVSFDRNGYRYHGKVKSLAEGAREGGLQF